MVTCLICGLRSDSLTSHIRVHQVTATEYRLKYPKAKLISAKVNRKRVASNLQRYGVRNVSANASILAKKRATWQEKYGTQHPLQNKKVLRGLRRTFKRRYGVSNSSQIAAVKLKKKQTTRLHYGVDNPNQSVVIKNRRKRTCRTRYGADHYWGSVEGKAARKSTWQLKYGVGNPMQHPTIARKNFISGVRGASGLEQQVIDLHIKHLDFVSHKVAVKFRNDKVKFPDFMMRNTKKVIEVNGYFHYPKFTHQSIAEHTQYLRREYKAAGYTCLVIWDTEFKNILAVRKKILSFLSTEAIRQVSKDKDMVHSSK